MRKNVRRGSKPRPEVAPAAKPAKAKPLRKQRKQQRVRKTGVRANRRIVPGESRVEHPEPGVASGLLARIDNLGPRTRKTLKFAGRFAGLATLAYALLLGAQYGHDYATTSPRFAVKDLVFEPTPHMPSERLVQTMGIAPGTNILSVDLEGLRETVVADPWVADATVERDLPDTLRVSVVEHEARAVLLAGEFFLVNSLGKPFKRLEPGERQDLPVITGVDREALDAGDEQKARETIVRALDVLAAYHSDDSKRPPLAEVHVADDGAISLYTAGYGTQIRLGRGPIDDKLIRFDALRAGLGERADTLAIVHLDQSAGPGRKDRIAASFLRREDEQAVLERGSGKQTSTADKPASEPAAPKPAQKPAVITPAGFKTAKKSPKRRIPRYE